ncbi:unnamed protein product [Diatraea saccharalis]|uniref:Exonuclease 3'-5' domain-containing protein 2 n=1 Tax=Diatraea saccharalis TaxID=40085 RepID=A0A9N9N438_9NEOP|nr:unnamed protein product [Diatraea saccharalis]
MEETKLKMYVTSTALLLSFAGVAYFVLRKRRKILDVTDAFNHLSIKIISDVEVCDEVVHELRRRCKKYKIIGFDCEWVTDHGKRKPVALMQLSTYDGYCGLFRLSHLKSVPNSLKNLLEDRTIYKVGVAPIDDAKYLFYDYSVAIHSTLDVRHIVALAGYHTGGLASLSQSLLNVTLDKSWRVRCSDWEAEELSARQVNYAAADAHVACKIFIKMIDKISKQNVWNIFNTRTNETWDNLDKLCSQYLDINFKSKKDKPDVNTK